MILNGTIGFLGFGNMGGAIASGLIEAGLVAAKHIAMYDVDEAKRAEAQQLGIVEAESAEALARQSSVLILAVKPQTMESALKEVRPGLAPQTLVISIAAGISIGFIQRQLGAEFRVVRVMPNTPALVNAGAAALAPSANCTEADIPLARAIFEAVGTAELVNEEAMDAVTALSGSGPAYFFYMVECMVAAAVAEGLPQEQAARLAAQTLLGAGRLLVESHEPPDLLRERVTSKGGTTEAALACLREEGFDRVVRAGLQAAAARSRTLGQ